MKLELADIANNESHKLNGFKVLGVIPFYLKLIKTETQIKLASIQNQIAKISESEATEKDFYNVEIQEKFAPLLKEYCLEGLLNTKYKDLQEKPVKLWFYNLFVRKPLKKKVYSCGYKHLFNMYLTIKQLNEPAFFLICWKSLKRPENTILSEAKPSLVKSSNTKKEQA